MNEIIGKTILQQSTIYSMARRWLGLHCPLDLESIRFSMARGSIANKHELVVSGVIQAVLRSRKKQALGCGGCFADAALPRGLFDVNEVHTALAMCWFCKRWEKRQMEPWTLRFAYTQARLQSYDVVLGNALRDTAEGSRKSRGETRDSTGGMDARRECISVEKHRPAMDPKSKWG